MTSVCYIIAWASTLPLLIPPLEKVITFSFVIGLQDKLEIVDLFVSSLCTPAFLPQSAVHFLSSDDLCMNAIFPRLHLRFSILDSPMTVCITRVWFGE